MKNGTQLEDVPELIMQHIQSRLPVKEAARTSVLSKSWLRAWSTIPSLRFHVRETNHLTMVDRTLNRYLHDNIQIERFDLDIRIDNEESASLAEKWIRSVAPKTCLKELCLSTNLDDNVSLMLLGEILLIGKNLIKLEVKSTNLVQYSGWMTDHTPIINCVSLRQLHLKDMYISQEVLNVILSSCSLLEKIELTIYSDLTTIKVINRPCLYELTLDLEYENDIALEISHVPNLRLFTCHLLSLRDFRPPNVCTLSLGRSITELNLAGLITDDAFLNMIKSGSYPFLESLTLDMRCWMSGCFHFTCASLKRLSLMRFPKDMLIDIKVYAPKLLSFCFGGYTMPSLFFPVSTLNQTMFYLALDMPVDTSFFLKMREALALSSYCEVSISLDYEPASDMDMDIDDLRTRLPYPPAKNVPRLSIFTFKDECLWEHSPFFDAFFEICHPKRVFAEADVAFTQNNHFCKLMLREVLEEKIKTTKRSGEYWPRYLKDVQIWVHPYWETLTNSHTRFLDGQTPFDVEFKLIWC